MKPKQPCVREWLASVDSDLEVYAAKFEEFGYNLNFLRETSADDLEEDLKEMLVKKVHCRVILHHHSVLKQRPLPERATTQADRSHDSSHAHGLVPCIADMLEFQKPGARYGT